MKKSMKIVLILSGLLVLATGVLLYGVLVLGWFDSVDEDTLEKLHRLEGYGADIIVYGNLDSIEGTEGIYRKISTINEESLTTENPNTYHMVVLYDVDGKLKVTNEELKLLRTYCMEKYYDLLYLGNEHYDQFVESGFLQYRSNDGEGGLHYACYKYHKDGIPYTFNGESWEHPDHPDTYYSNPFLTEIYWTEEELRLGRPEDAWSWIAEQATESIEGCAE